MWYRRNLPSGVTVSGYPGVGITTSVGPVPSTALLSVRVPAPSFESKSSRRLSGIQAGLYSGPGVNVRRLREPVANVQIQMSADELTANRLLSGERRGSR